MSMPPSAVPKLPLPLNSSTPELDELRRFSRDVLHENIDNLRGTGAYIRRAFRTLYVMYVILFAIGSLTAVAAVVKSLTAQSAAEAAGTVAIAGLSAASFFALFLSRPLEALERTSLYATWVTAATNTYWTRLLYFSDGATIDRDLTSATDELVRNLAMLRQRGAASKDAPSD
jgi:hypothetical protein